MTRIKRTKDGKAFLVEETPLQVNRLGEIKWILTFKSGGWNTVWAKSESTAWRRARKEYGDLGVVAVRPCSVAMEEAAMRTFY